MVLLTDGRSSSTTDVTVRAAGALKSIDGGRQVSLFAVALGADPDLTTLTRVAGVPPSRYLLRMTGQRPYDVTTVARQLLDRICRP